MNLLFLPTVNSPFALFFFKEHLLYKPSNLFLLERLWPDTKPKEKKSRNPIKATYFGLVCPAGNTRCSCLANQSPAADCCCCWAKFGPQDDFHKLASHTRVGRGSRSLKTQELKQAFYSLKRRKEIYISTWILKFCMKVSCGAAWRNGKASCASRPYVFGIPTRTCINMFPHSHPRTHFRCTWNAVKNPLSRACWSGRLVSGGHGEIEINLRFTQASRFILHNVYTGDQSRDLPTWIKKQILSW